MLSDHDLSEYYYSSRPKTVIPFSRDLARCNNFPIWINVFYNSLLKQTILHVLIVFVWKMYVLCNKNWEKNIYFKLHDFLWVGSLRLSTCLSLYLSGCLPAWFSAVVTSFGHVICHIIVCDQGFTTLSMDLRMANFLCRWLISYNPQHFQYETILKALVFFYCTST